MQENKYDLQNNLIKDFQKNKKSKTLKKLIILYDDLLSKLSNKINKKYVFIPLTYEDFKQYATYCFIKRTLNYKFDTKINYASYIEKFIEFDLLNYARKFSNDKHKMLNFSNYDLNESIIENYISKDFDIYDLNISNLNSKQKLIFISIIENEGNIKKVSKELEIPIKTLYKYRETIIKKLNIINSVI